ncbi:MAG: hypothetical protein K2X29_01980, partial [Candidatus Obscuribacterales bacterium]|nr:hypothetical protein [Candidatus Obscuribacterales bacterium]
IEAARRYESLFFCFDYETDGFEPRPYDVDCHMRLALTLAEGLFENLQQTSEQLTHRYKKPRRGRPLSEPLPENIGQLLQDAKRKVPTNVAAVKRLMDLGVIPVKQLQNGRTPTAKSVLRKIEKAEKERTDRARQAMEDFKDVALSDYLPEASKSDTD